MLNKYGEAGAWLRVNRALGDKMDALQLMVVLGERSYPVIIGDRRLGKLGHYLHQYGRELSRTCLLVSNPTVDGLYGEAVRDSLEQAGFTVATVLVPDTEESKSLAEAARLYDAAVEVGLDRGSPVVALGGGVVGDLAGFIAATYMRGVPFIQVPTTLLAQVDASVGGKVAINHPRGKNLIGAFYQPQLVLADLDTLRTLPEREVRAGLAEVVKYGVIRAADFFAFLEGHVPELLALDPAIMREVIYRSCAIKAEVVAADEREGSLRAILNFGHTVGHAIEAVTAYREYHHGEAVAIGMVVAGRMALQLGRWTPGEQERLEKLLGRLGLPVSPPVSVEPDRLVEAMILDKKAREQRLTFILPRKIGKVEICHDVPRAVVQVALISR